MKTIRPHLNWRAKFSFVTRPTEMRLIRESIIFLKNWVKILLRLIREGGFYPSLYGNSLFFIPRIRREDTTTACAKCSCQSYPGDKEEGPCQDRINFKILLLTFKTLNGIGPVYLRDLLIKSMNNQLIWYVPKIGSVCCKPFKLQQVTRLLSVVAVTASQVIQNFNIIQVISYSLKHIY